MPQYVHFMFFGQGPWSAFLHRASGAAANVGTRHAAVRAVTVRLATGGQDKRGDEGDHEAHLTPMRNRAVGITEPGCVTQNVTPTWIDGESDIDKLLESLASPARFERTAPRLGIWCSIRLSYGDHQRQSLYHPTPQAANSPKPPCYNKLVPGF
jgi:hypothetical protein